MLTILYNHRHSIVKSIVVAVGAVVSLRAADRIADTVWMATLPKDAYDFMMQTSDDLA